MVGFEGYAIYVTTIASIVGLFLVSYIAKVLYMILLKPRLLERSLKKQGIHGPPYKLWLGGGKKTPKTTQQPVASKLDNTPSHDILPRLNPQLYQSMKQYGKLFYIWTAIIPRVLVVEPKLIREVLTNKSGDFLQPDLNAFTRLFTGGLTYLNGDKWAMHRKIISPAFHMEKLKGMLPSLCMCTDGMIEKWEGVMGSKESCELDVFSEFQKLTADIISHVAFGSSYEEGSKVFQLLNEQAKLIAKVYYIAAFPWLRHLPTKTNTRMKQIDKEVTTMLRGIVKKREETIKMGGNHVKDDLLGLLLESNLNEQRENKNSRNCAMTLDEIIEECKLFYFAGHETTATLLTWTIVALSMHQDWQEKARDEVFKLIGRDKTPTSDDLSRLKTVTVVLQETLRLYPPASVLRTTGRKGAKLGDKHLPSGVHVYIPTPFVHRDEQVWGDNVLEFDPGRFSEGISKASDKDPAPYFAFGWGPRVCIGQNLAMLEAKMALCKMLQRFSFELSPSYAHIPYFLMTLQPLRGAPVIVRGLHAR